MVREAAGAGVLPLSWRGDGTVAPTAIARAMGAGEALIRACGLAESSAAAPAAPWLVSTACTGGNAV